jgi:RNA recognition motif-containing protein
MAAPRSSRPPRRDDSAKLFVGSLSYDTTTDELKRIFNAFAKVVDCHVAQDKDSGASRGFAFVTFDSEEHANAALTEFDGMEIGGRSIKVSLAKQGERNHVVVGHGAGEEVNISAYHVETITEAQQRVVLRKSKLPSEMRIDHSDSFVYSDDEPDDDPEKSFVDSLSSKEKKRLLRKLAADGEGSKPLGATGHGETIKNSKNEKKKKSKKKEKKHKKESKRKKSDSSSSGRELDENHENHETSPKKRRR